MKCPRCGGDSVPGSAFCESCGAPLAPVQGAQAPPPVQSGFTPRGVGVPPQKSNVWIWVLVAIFGTCLLGAGVLTAILLPVFNKARIAAKSTFEISKAKEIDLAVLMFQNDHGDKFPPLNSGAELGKLLKPYFYDNGKQGLPETVQSYVWNQDLSGKDAYKLSAPAETWLLYSPTPDYRGKYVVGWADGHCEFVTKEELDSARAKPSKMESDDHASTP